MYVFKHMRNHELMNDYRRCLSAAIARNSYTSRENLIRTVLSTSRPKFDVLRLCAAHDADYGT